MVVHQAETCSEKVKIYTTDCQGWAVTITERQLAILQMLADGKDGPGICDSVHISASTLKKQLTVIVQKFGAEGRTHAVAKALRAGLIQ